MTNDWTLLAESTRGRLTENQHFGIAVVADTDGRVVHAWGNPQRLVFPRSALKPMQAMPVLQSGAAAHYGFGREELALTCASHSGEPRHVARVAAMLARAGLDATALQCGCHIPAFHLDRLDEGVPPLSSFSPLHHNCSGKHAGFLACACHLGERTDNYLDPDHPVQRAVREAILHTTGVSSAMLHLAVDGCSAPTYAFPLAGLATAYARIGSASGDSTAGTLRDAMLAHPELVSGSGRSDAFLMSAGRGQVLAKGGADGVQAIGLPALGLGVAVKIADGSARAAVAVAIAVLNRLGLLTTLDEAARMRWLNPPVRSIAGAPVGEFRTTLK